MTNNDGQRQPDRASHGALTPDITLLGLAPEQVSTTTLPAIAALADGGYVLAWVSHEGAESLHLQRFDATGEKAGAERQMVLGWDDAEVVAVGTGSGGFAVAYEWLAWISIHYVYQQGVSLQNFLPDGTPGTRTVVDSEYNETFRSNRWVGDPSLAPLDDGGYVLAWHWSTLSESRTMLLRFDGDGKLVGNQTWMGLLTLTPMSHGGYLLGSGLYDGQGNFVATLDPEFNALYRAIDALENGGYAIAFTSAGSLYTQRLDASGAPIGEPTLVSSGSTRFELVGLSDGTYALIWSQAWVNEGLLESAVWVRRFDSAGQPLGEAQRIQAPEPYDAGADRLAGAVALEDGGFALTWTVLSDDGVTVFTQRFEEARLGSEGSDPLAGTAQADVLYGLAGADRLRGLDGDDKLDGGEGRDALFGGPGNDHYVVDDRHDRVVERPGDGADTVHSSVSWRLDTEVENLVLTGVSAIDGWGNSQANLITGNAAANRLDGGLGNDTLDGGAGPDVLVFSTRLGADNVDVLLNFVAAEDMIELDANVFRALKREGTWSAEAFAHGAAATDPADRIIHDPASGALLYDPDGSGAEAAVQFAVLVGLVGDLSADNFVIV